MGLTNGQFSLLMSLNRPSPPSMKEVASLLAMDRTTLTANLKPLERRQLVTITVDDADRRSRLMTLTPAGQALLAAAYPIWQQAQSALEKRLAGTDLDQLRAALIALS
ncbi:MarR family winged helix-turn-helix transcriptional regulator [Dongia soli]